MPIDFEIREVTESTDSIVSSMKDLLSQLTSTSIDFNSSALDEILNSISTKLFVALVEHNIVGTYTLVIFRIPTGATARIEDVVVEEKWRGKGIGKKMMKHAIELVKKEGIFKIELTSHHSRIEANKLYQSLGFEQIETNVYRLYV